ncbi:MAG: methylphosphotriester-DNA--protein-cysteine methyltransferase family protein [Lachnospiraceae bacterium]|nr:methylphosphotriester-DNA--protein-cysteine methyltransferase family protein [Lachnospiraceae bacterium]
MTGKSATNEQWNAILQNDKHYDGSFFYAVKTTGVVCRPSCTSRQCNRENTIIYDTLDQAVSDGFRPCRRCHPELPHWNGAQQELTEAAKAYLKEHYTEKFSLEQMADALFVNESYLLRCFKECAKTTPLRYHNELRCIAAKELLIRFPNRSISYIGNEAGFASAAHFSRVFKEICGCTPSRYRAEKINL